MLNKAILKTHMLSQTRMMSQRVALNLRTRRMLQGYDPYTLDREPYQQTRMENYTKITRIRVTHTLTRRACNTRRYISSTPSNSSTDFQTSLRKRHFVMCHTCKKHCRTTTNPAVDCCTCSTTLCDIFLDCNKELLDKRKHKRGLLPRLMK